MMKPILIVSLMICLGILAVPVMAETLTGEIAQSATSYRPFTIAKVGGSGSESAFGLLNVYTTQNTLGFKTLIRMDNGYRPTFSGTKSGNTSNISVYHGTQLIGTGTFGYVRLWNISGTEQNGYQYLSMNSWNVSTLTGNEAFSITGASIDGISCAMATCLGSGTPAAGDIVWSQYGTANQNGNYINYNDLITKSSYVATSPSGLGIQGTLNKSVSGTIYGSRGLVVNATDMQLLQSQDIISTNNMDFNIWNATSIKLGMVDALGTITYSPSLFTDPVVVPTPTLPSGWTRTTVYTRDSNTNAQITGTTINIEDIENVSWKNSTADADGILYIDTPVYHALNIYCSDPGGGYTPSSELAAVSGGNYYMPMVPVWSVAPAGWVNLFVNVYDSADRLSVPYANVNTRLPTGATEGTSTGISGTASFVVPNSTVVIITVSKSGYQTTGKTITTPVSGDQSTNINIARLVVTVVPTATVVPGEVTVRPTVLPGCEDPTSSACALAQDQNMMATVRTFAPTLITIACLMTLLYLMGWKP